MIADQIKGKDFYGLLAYHEKKVSEGKGYFLDSNIAYAKTVEMTQEFNLVRQLRPSLSTAVYHVSLNLPHGDQLDDTNFIALGWEYLQGMGFTDNQYIMYRHVDQEHSHIHIIANRVMFSGELVSDSKDYKRSKTLVGELERKYGLTILPERKKSKVANLTKSEIEKTFRTGEAPLKYQLQQKIKKSLSLASNIESLIQELKSKGISPKFNISKSTGRVSGVSFEFQGVIYKGSTLGRNFSWNNIIKHIDYEQDRDCKVILEANGTERRDEGIDNENGGTTAFDPGTTGRTKTRTGKIGKKPGYHLGKTQADGLMEDYLNNSDWNGFKLELRAGKKGKKRRRRGPSL